ncbi:hypothetical protein M885DRAFT_501403 [Pelagophyceae sp. CCMP2097]|nr:hypothetical protein M885DRAFT_501403 [Pelagophyceae sp. CCMP2097]
MRCSAWMVLTGGAALVTAALATDEGGDGMAMTVARELFQLAPPSVFRKPRASVQMVEMGIGDGGRGGRAGIGGGDGGLAFYDRVGIDDDDGVSIDDGGGLSIDSDECRAERRAQNAYYASLHWQLRSSNISFVDHDPMRKASFRIRTATCGASRAGWITVSYGKNRSKYKGTCAATTNVNLASDVNMTSK